MHSPTQDSMTSAERRAGVSLAAIFGLRMLGLFLILPVFSVAAQQIPGGDNFTLVGIALGAYGLTQAMFQIPFGIASDRFGRKPVIVFGLLLFAAGSFFAAFANDIYFVIAGRVLQGAGAISAAVSALAADLTREQHRTKVMAMIGSSIGLVFAGSLVAAPLLYAAIGLSGLFALTGALALAAIALVRYGVPPAPPVTKPTTPVRPSEVLLNPQLLRLNFGIFSLHLMQMAMFVVIPSALKTAGNLPLAAHWKVYLPAILASFVLMVPAIIFAERHGRVKEVFIGAIVLLLLTQIGFVFGQDSFSALAGLILSFFVAFNILEASLPSLISRIAPGHARGFALGVYNTTQACGLFLGGWLGGWLTQNVGGGAVFALSSGLAAVWLVLAWSMTPPPLRVQPHPVKTL
jgi:MFS family permease